MPTLGGRISERFGDIGVPAPLEWLFHFASNEGYRYSASFLAFLIDRYGAAHLILQHFRERGGL